MQRFIVRIAGNVVADISEAGDSGDEDLGLEWAISELRDSYRHDKRVDGAYSLAGDGELAEFLDAVRGLLGEAALGGHEGRLAAAPAGQADARHGL